MANEQNLVRGDQAHKLTAEDARKGGKRSGEVRREKRDLRKVMEWMLSKEYTDKKSGDVKTGAELIAFKQFQKALEGDTKAFEVVRDTAGFKPVDKVMVSEVEQSVIDEVEKMVMEEEKPKRGRKKKS